MSWQNRKRKRFDIDLVVNEKEGKKTYSLRSVGYDQLYETFLRILWWPEGSSFEGKVLADEKEDEDGVS